MQTEQHSQIERDTPLKLRELRHVVLLAEELHFARAADRAYLSQSAFSRSIAAVEEDLGLRLFDRGPRHVVPTAAGERMISRARRLLSSVKDLAQEAAQLRSGELGDVALGSGPFSSLLLMTSALVEMRRRHPSVCARLEIDHTGSLQRQLQDERLAFFVSDLHELLHSDVLAIEPLGDFTGAMFCRHDHRLARIESPRLADLKGEQYATVHLPQEVRRRIDTYFAAHGGGELAIAFECENVAALRELALHTDVILLVPQQTVRHDLEAGRLRQLHIAEFGPLGAATPLRSTLGMVWLRERTPTTSTRLLMDIVREEAERVLLPRTQGHAAAG